MLYNTLEGLVDISDRVHSEENLAAESCFRHVSRPVATLAGVVVDGSRSAVSEVRDAARTRVESCFIVRVGVQAVGFAVAEARSWSVCGGGGGGGWGGGGLTRFGGGG